MASSYNYKLVSRKWSYKIQNSDGVFYQKTEAHLKPYTSHNKNVQWTQPVSQLMAQSHHMQPVKQFMAQSDHKKSVPVNNPTQVRTSTSRDAKAPVKLDL